MDSAFSGADFGARFGPGHRARAHQHPPSSGSAPSGEKAALRPPAETLTPSPAVLFPSVRPRLSVGLSPCDGAASASLRSAKSALGHLHGLRAAGSTTTCILRSQLEMPRCRAGFCHLPQAGSGDGARKSQRWIVPSVTGACPLRAGWGDTAVLEFAGSRRWIAFLEAGHRQRVSCVRRFRSASPALPRSLPRVMSLWFSGPRAGFQGRSLQGGLARSTGTG